MNGDDSKLQSSRRKRLVMNDRALIAIFLGILFSLYPTTVSSPQNGTSLGDLEYIYNATTSIMDDMKESIFTIKLKCRRRTSDIVACRLEDPQYQTTYHRSPCDKTVDLCDREHLRADNSYIGRFEIKLRRSSVERLTVSSRTSLKQLSFYRIMAGHLVAGVDVNGKPEGTYSLIEESVYGKCEALVKVVRSRIKNEQPENESVLKLVTFPRDIGNETNTDNLKNFHEMLSIKRTRNLDTCYPVPGLLIFDAFFYHPMMTSVHYDIKSSISRMIVRDRAFTSYTTEDIAMKNIERPNGNTTMLHVRTTLTLHSIDRVDKPFPRIIDPISVELPFVDGFNPANKSNDDNNNNNNTTNDNNNNAANHDNATNNNNNNNVSNYNNANNTNNNTNKSL